MCKVFAPVGIATSDSITNFLLINYFYSGLYAGLIYLEMVGHHSCRRQSMGRIKQFNCTFWCHDYSLLLGSTCSIASGTLCESQGVIQGLRYCTAYNKKHTRTLRDHSLERETAHTEMITITGHFEWILTTLEPTAIATGGGYKIIMRALCTAVNFIQLGFSAASLFTVPFSHEWHQVWSVFV